MQFNLLAVLQVGKPPFNISNGNACLPLGQNTAAMSVSHHDGTLQYDTHNLYGLQVRKSRSSKGHTGPVPAPQSPAGGRYPSDVMSVQEVAVSHRVLPTVTGKRPFILTR